MNIHRFTVPVNCYLENNDERTLSVQDHEEIYEDHGFIILPESYTENGTPTRLVICCHGAGGCVSVNDSQVEKTVFAQYLLANGYAVMDVNGLPFEYAEKYDIDIRNNIGSPIAVRAYIKAYFYCMEHFNLKREVFVHGGSMGGISSANLVLSGAIPVVAHTALCPVLDTYNQIFLNPWSYGLPKFALGKIYKLDTDENGEYIYDEKKICGYNPAKNMKAAYYPVPVKFWHCVDDNMVAFEVTERFVNRIKENGGVASLRAFPMGAHGPERVGDLVENPTGNPIFEGNRLEIRPAAEEAFVFIRKYDLNA